jgi:ankyrin repeat protein
MSNKLSSKRYIFRLLFSTAIVLSILACTTLAFCKQIHVAAQKGDLNKVQMHVKANPALVNAKDGSGYTPLHWAAYYGHMDVADFLLTNSADVNAKSNVGWTPLHDAAAYGHMDVVELLLAKGADINAKDKNGVTPLHIVARGRNKDIAEILLVKGADVNAKTNLGQTPLHVAAAHNHKDMLKLLLAKGADVNEKSNNGMTPLHDAAAYGHTDVAELLLTNAADVNAKSNAGWTPLHFAALHGRKDLAELLLSKGTAVNVKDKGGDTPLHVAANRGYKDIVELLIAHGAGVNVKDKDSAKPLHVTATPNSCSEINLAVDNIASGYTNVGANEQLCLTAILGFDKAAKCKEPLRSGVTGLELMRKDAWVCVSVSGKRPLEVNTGWLPISNWKRDLDAVPPEPQAWAGVWQNERARLNITVIDNRVNIDGHAIWSGRLSPHFGDLNFEGVPNGDRLANQAGECQATFRRIGEYIIAKDNAKCGGMNVTFSGVYRFRPGLRPKALVN